jgi:methionyl aminopeptidase
MIPIKSPKEIDRMRQACRTASEILDRVTDLIRPGISTKEVDLAAADLMAEAGVQSAFLGYRLASRFPRQHLHFAQRRDRPRDRRPAADLRTIS